MKISNKLSTKDFVNLQKILFEEHSLSPSLKFMLKWVSSLLYGLAAFIGIYLISAYTGNTGYIIPTVGAILVFILLVIFYPQRTKRKMDSIISRYYGKENLDVVRDTTITEKGISYKDDKGEKSYDFKDLKYHRTADERLYLIFPEETGTIVNLEGISTKDRERIMSWIEKK